MRANARGISLASTTKRPGDTINISPLRGDTSLAELVVVTIQSCPNCGAKNRINEMRASAHRPICGKCGTPLSRATATDYSKPQIVNDASFAADVIAASSGMPVLVDAWAEWCGPCRMVAPALDQLAAESNGKYKIAKLNVDENPRTATQFNIRSIPTMLIFKNGKLVDQIVGAQPKQAIAASLQ
ncbi:MAG TPA: thioredoxin, partial [Pyrinomonadaceae bacterium]|nr:thioredoxin [Pyrinomonadaceae bacterium]